MELTIHWQNYNSCLVDESSCLEKLLGFLLFFFACIFFSRLITQCLFELILNVSFEDLLASWFHILC